MSVILFVYLFRPYMVWFRAVSMNFKAMMLVMDGTIPVWVLVN